MDLYKKIKQYENSAAKEWFPDKFEVMFWDFDYAKKSKHWLKDFPDFNSSAAKKWREDFYSVYIDKEFYEKFKEYYLSLEQEQAVEINGKKMAISYRLPFPNL